MELKRYLEEIVSTLFFRKRIQQEEAQLLNYQVSTCTSLAQTLESAAKNNPNFPDSQNLKISYSNGMIDSYGNSSISLSVGSDLENNILQVNINLAYHGEEIYVFDRTVGNSKTYSLSELHLLTKDLSRFAQEYKKGMSFLTSPSIYRSERHCPEKEQ